MSALPKVLIFYIFIVSTGTTIGVRFIGNLLISDHLYVCKLLFQIQFVKFITKWK